MSELFWWSEAGVAPLADAAAAPQAPREALAARASRGRVDLVLSVALQHQLVCPAELPLEGARAIAAYAEQQFIHYFGTDAEYWPLAVWQAGPVRGVSALHGAARQAWAALQSQPLKQRVGRVLPAWAVALSTACSQHPQWPKSPQAALAWVEGPVLCWLVLQEGRLTDLRQLRTRDLSDEALWDLVDRLRQPGQIVLVLGYGRNGAETETPLPEDLLVPLRLDTPRPHPESLQQATACAGLRKLPDFQALQPRSPAWWRWPLAACSALVLATAVMDTHAAWSARESARDHQTLALRAATPKSAANPARVRSEPKTAAAAQAALQHPWELVLAQVERAGRGAGDPGAGVSWLALEHRAGASELRLEGQGADTTVAMRVAQDWTIQPAWTEVLLTRFQMAPEGGQRFELSAKADLQMLKRLQDERAAPEEPRP